MQLSKADGGQLSAVVAEMHELDPNGFRAAQVLRNTFDQLYDGQCTGRYRWDQLYRTEREGYGDVVAINLQREFKFEDGVELDYRINGVEVDCKYSQTIGGWMIPPEAVGHLCLLLCAQDSAAPKWSMGLVRASRENLNLGANRDCKSTLNGTGRKAITWFFNEVPLPPNVLLQLDQAAVAKIMAMKSGQQRINELFRIALGRRVGRAVVATVAQQDDYMKRVRKNGGARSALKPEGIIILGQYESHAAIARKLGLPVPGPGELVSARVVPAIHKDQAAKLEGRIWRLASDQDPVIPAPELPDI